MTTGERPSTEPSGTRPVRTPNRRSRVLIGAAAAMLVLIFGIGTWVIVGGSEGDDVAAEVSVVLSQYEAWNNGDYDGWSATLTEELAQEETGGGFPYILFNSNQQIEVVEPCRVIGTSPVGESTVQCVTTVRSDFYGPAGIAESVTETFVVNAEGKISSIDSDGECCSAQFEHNRKFWQWLRSAYPDVHEEIKPFDGESLPGWRGDPADMLIAVQYVEEFVAQSDAYPISP